MDSGRSKPCFFSTSSTLTLMPHCVHVLTGLGMSAPRTCSRWAVERVGQHVDRVRRDEKRTNTHNCRMATQELRQGKDDRGLVNNTANCTPLLTFIPSVLRAAATSSSSLMHWISICHKEPPVGRPVVHADPGGHSNNALPGCVAKCRKKGR